jgi:hypothetical protein
MFVGGAVTQQRLLYICLFHDRCLAAVVVYSRYSETALHATLLLLLLLLLLSSGKRSKGKFYYVG